MPREDGWASSFASRHSFVLENLDKIAKLLDSLHDAALEETVRLEVGIVLLHEHVGSQKTASPLLPVHPLWPLTRDQSRQVDRRAQTAHGSGPSRAVQLGRRPRHRAKRSGGPQCPRRRGSLPQASLGALRVCPLAEAAQMRQE